MTARKKSQNVKSPKTGQRSPAGSTSKQKGKLVERIAAMLHEGPDVKVERNVLLPPLNGDPKRKREIDVLLTSYVAGYPVRIAIECKNEAEKNDVEYIDAFVGKLDDVGIPHQHGIFISVSGYTVCFRLAGAFAKCQTAPLHRRYTNIRQLWADCFS